MSEESTEANIIYDEVHAVVRRYLSEGDKLTCFGVIGALEAVKLDVLDMLAHHNGKDRHPDEK